MEEDWSYWIDCKEHMADMMWMESRWFDRMMAKVDICEELYPLVIINSLEFTMFTIVYLLQQVEESSKKKEYFCEAWHKMCGFMLGNMRVYCRL